MVRNWKRMASVAYGSAMTRLSLNFYLYLEELPLAYEEGMGSQQALDRQYMELLGWYLEGKDSRVLEKVKDFREQVIQEMETVVAYSDAFQIYEYVLNRMERRFEDSLPVPEEGEEELVGNLMHYLASAGDTVLQNQRIHETLRQLPVRFTRQKYFSMVHDAMTTYIGSDSAGLEEVMYLLRSGSLIEISRRRKEGYRELNTRLEGLEALSFKDLTKESYQNARKQLETAADMIRTLSEYCTNLQEMVNDLYILCLTKEDAMRDAAKEETVQAILQGLWKQYHTGGGEISEEITRLLPELEGVQEEYYEKYQKLSFRQEDASGQEDETDRLAAQVDMLMSASTFADLDENRGKGSVTREELEEQVSEFFAQLQPILASCQKPVMRAIMATTLSYLPIQFQSSQELQSYIRNSLSCCTDSAEKATCMELLRQMMETDGYELV